MTLEEMRSRLANRDAIREKQEQEERAEEEREMEELAKQRKEAALERKRLQAGETDKSKQNTVNSTSSSTIAAAADSEQERKWKAVFLKETSKVVVKILEDYRREDVAKIKSKEDFKNLAKKVSSFQVFHVKIETDFILFLQLTHTILEGEMKHGRKAEDLKVTDRVKRKTTDFVHKFMAKYEGGN